MIIIIIIIHQEMLSFWRIDSTVYKNTYIYIYHANQKRGLQSWCKLGNSPKKTQESWSMGFRVARVPKTDLETHWIIRDHSPWGSDIMWRMLREKNLNSHKRIELFLHGTWLKVLLNVTQQCGKARLRSSGVLHGMQGPGLSPHCNESLARKKKCPFQCLSQVTLEKYSSPPTLMVLWKMGVSPILVSFHFG